MKGYVMEMLYSCSLIPSVKLEAVFTGLGKAKLAESLQASICRWHDGFCKSLNAACSLNSWAVLRLCGID